MPPTALGCMHSSVRVSFKCCGVQDWVLSFIDLPRFLVQFDFDVSASIPGVILAFGMTMAFVVRLYWHYLSSVSMNRNPAHAFQNSWSKSIDLLKSMSHIAEDTSTLWWKGKPSEKHFFQALTGLLGVGQVGLSINSMSLCGLIHAAVMKMGKMYVSESEEAEFMRRCRAFALQ